jgi:hypothetical protein
MNTIDLAKLVKWEDVKRAIKYFYPDDKNNYEDVFNKIRNYKPVKINKREFLKIWTWHIVKNNPILDIEDVYYDVCTNKYSLSFRDWNEVASLQIEKSTLEHLIPVDIIAHIIWEITFYGDEEQMKNTQKEILDDIREIDNKEVGVYKKN